MAKAASGVFFFTGQRKRGLDLDVNGGRLQPDFLDLVLELFEVIGRHVLWPDVLPKLPDRVHDMRMFLDDQGSNSEAVQLCKGKSY